MKKLNSPASAFVVGADLDKSLLSSLVKGDRVLCEMNGARVFSSFTNPLVADKPWVVVSNDEKKLVLEHPEMTRHLSLPYSKLLKIRKTEPAVFLIKDKYLSPGDIYIILQFVSHRMAIGAIHKQFPMAFDAELVLKEDRQGVLEAIVDKISEFTYPGWGYMGVCRFALRSSVRAPIISAFRDRDMKVVGEQDDVTIVKMMREMNWLPYLLAQSNPYSEAAYSEPAYEKKLTGENVLPSNTDE